MVRYSRALDGKCWFARTSSLYKCSLITVVQYHSITILNNTGIFAALECTPYKRRIGTRIGSLEFRTDYQKIRCKFLVHNNFKLTHSYQMSIEYGNTGNCACNISPQQQALCLANLHLKDFLILETTAIESVSFQLPPWVLSMYQCFLAFQVREESFFKT